MSDNLFSQRFYGQREAWHKKGIVDPSVHNAVEAWSMMTPYTLEKRRLQVQLSEMPGAEQAWTDIPFYQIVRGFVPDDPYERMFGIVSEQYQLLEPQAVCEAWDESANLPVCTMGSLGLGEKFFITADIGSLNVKGDKSESYLFLACPYNPGEAISLIRTQIRVVCQNTWQAASRQGVWEWKGNHNNSDLLNHLKIWLEHTVQKARGETAEVQAFMDVLGDYKLQKDDVYNALFNVYPSKDFRPDDWPRKLQEKKAADFESWNKSQAKSRDLVDALFSGKGTPMENRALNGTGWHLFQAFTEYEDYKKSTKDATESIIMGDRADAKAKAGRVLYEMATVR